MAIIDQSKKFKVDFITEGPLLIKAQELRKKSLFGVEGLDQDIYDNYFRHLVISDIETENVVGTYRLLLGSVAAKHKGFFAETRFDLSNIKKNCQGEILEMSRACVDEEYRKYKVLNIMWKSIFHYMDQHQVRYILGTPRIEGVDPEKIGKIMKFFQKNCFSAPELRAYPAEGLRYAYPKYAGDYSDREIVRVLPSLIKGYLKMGAQVCSEPASQPDLDIVTVFMLLDMKNLNQEFRSRFL